MYFGALVFILPLAATIRAEENGAYFKIEEKSFLFFESTISNKKADSLLLCSQMCARRAGCKSANFIASQKTCSLLSEEQTNQPKNLFKEDDSFYLEKVWWQSVVQTQGLCYLCRQAFDIEKSLSVLFNAHSLRFHIILIGLISKLAVKFRLCWMLFSLNF